MSKLDEAQYVTMKQLGVKPMLWLHEKGESTAVLLFAVIQICSTNNSVLKSSYLKAINTFRKLPAITPPQQKLMCLIETGRLVRHSS